ncbi:uncharacterized protein F5147DRAFT_654516 [Suillus discolor]|uniref:Uncharacterized protein n=1 Tax=Suillus discolor TaxID=1912936 RepID=A0A9P7F2N0_9AGAM|nr:uncharacterized protein F5147DRAFT_654516 [Suillus discolor]KAG2103997.1 hypothetical protein F5147DRAFT_654516 [Suillus discolor]
MGSGINSTTGYRKLVPKHRIRNQFHRRISEIGSRAWDWESMPMKRIRNWFWSSIVGISCQEWHWRIQGTGWQMNSLNVAHRQMHIQNEGRAHNLSLSIAGGVWARGKEQHLIAYGGPTINYSHRQLGPRVCQSAARWSSSPPGGLSVPMSGGPTDCVNQRGEVMTGGPIQQSIRLGPGQPIGHWKLTPVGYDVERTPNTEQTTVEHADG